MMIEILNKLDEIYGDEYYLVLLILVSSENIRVLLVFFRILWYIVVNEFGLLLGLKNGIDNMDIEECFKMVDKSCLVWLGLFMIKVWKGSNYEKI